MPHPTLCERCQGCLHRHESLIDTGDHEIVAFYFHHWTLSTLRSSAGSGCPVCEPLYHQLEPVLALNPPFPAPDEPLTYLFETKLDFGGAQGNVLLCAMLNSTLTTFDGIPHVGLPLSFRLDNVEETSKYYPVAELSSSTGSPESWATALQWLNECLRDHPNCAKFIDTSWYPTRLVDIGTDNKAPVRVVDTASARPQGGYLTLSHRWGNDPVTKLLRSTDKDLREGIDVGAFPLTIRHGIEVARRLNKRYVWIDSLCIYQDEDDLSDWAREVVHMDQVYSNSTLNIAATGAKSDQHGLFFERDPDKELRPCIISCSATKNLTDLQDYVLTDFNFPDRNLTGAPLNQRGWVLQERLLSPRVLHFGEKQLFWECRSKTACERYPISFPPAFSNHTVLRFKVLDPGNYKSNKIGLNVEDIPKGPNTDLIKYNTWSTVIRAYSATKLTFLKDRAVAISGIAKFMRDVYFDGAEYVAGLWRDCLAGGLLWSVQNQVQVDFVSSTRSFFYRAPTWSWLSVEGEVNPGRTVRAGLWIRVIDVTVVNAPGQDATGMIEDASIILRGRLRQLKIRPLTVYSQEIDQYVPVPSQWMLNVGGVDLVSPEDGRDFGERLAAVVSLDVPHSDFGEANHANELFLMSGGGPWDIADYPFSHGDVDLFHDMLLLRCVDRVEGVFHRFGLAQVQTEKHPDVFATIKALDEDESTLPCIEYDAESHLHTIMLK